MFLLDVSASGRFGSGQNTKLDTAAEICALLAFSAIQNNDKVGAVVFSDHVEKYIPPDKGRTHALHVVRELLFFEPEGKGTDIGEALSFLLRVLKRRAIVFVLSDFMSPEFSKPMGLASKKFDLVALNIKDVREEQLTGTGLFRLWDQERGVEKIVDLGGRAARERYAAHVNKRDEELKSLFNRYGVDRVDIDTQSDYTKPLSLFFRARAKRL
jgi:uncharacterized protein (DUF58 family)